MSDADDTNRRVEWEAAPSSLRHLVRIAGIRKGGPVIVGIGGPVGSGKSTLARSLAGTCLATDDYLPDYADVPESERDEPRHADLALLSAHLSALASGRGVVSPVWCFREHRRIGWRHVEPDDLIVCEGIFALHGDIRPRLDVAVFVESPAATRWSRWERLEATGARGWGVERARQYFEHVAEPTFAAYAAEYRRGAHLVVRNAGVAEPGSGAQV